MSLRPLLGAALVAAAFAGVPTPAGAATPVPPHVVADPYWGEVIFQFYQDEYFTALTELMAAQAQGRVPHHDDEAEILRGGLLLSYGLEKQAGELFERLLAGHAAPAVRDRAWYFLAKIRYQRGLDADAEAALNRVEHPLPAPLEEQRQLLSAQLLMARGDYATATTVLDKLVHPATGISGWFSSYEPSLFARYNLGVAQVRAGKAAEGTKVLDAIGTMKAPDEETRALRDRANVALGFSALQDDHPADARKYLERVRLQGPSSNKALLGFGWAAAALKQYDKALVPWTELAGREADDAAVLEARLATPYAYGELGAAGQALTRYEDALAAFDAENQRLDESIADLRKGSLVDALSARNPRHGMGWYQSVAAVPAVLPHPGHLTDVLAQNDFQEGFKNWRDLQFLDGNLSHWKQQMGVFGQMLDNRRQGYAQRLPQVHARAATLNVDGLQKRRDALSDEVAQAEKDADGMALANASERALLVRLARVREALAKSEPGADPQLDAARERQRLVEGAMAWRLAEAEPGRLWDAKKGLKATDTNLAQARVLEDELARAEKEEPARFERLAARLADLEKRLDALAPRVNALSKEQQQALQGLAIAALQAQKERLAGYTAQARYAVAQLYDQATRKERGDATPAKDNAAPAKTGGANAPR